MWDFTHYKEIGYVYRIAGLVINSAATAGKKDSPQRRRVRKGETN